MRLKWTFKKVPEKYKTSLAEMETLMSMDGSFKNYRAAIAQNTEAIPGFWSKSLRN